MSETRSDGSKMYKCKNCARGEEGRESGFEKQNALHNDEVETAVAD
jgi:hypothetical protein